MAAIDDPRRNNRRIPHDLIGTCTAVSLVVFGAIVHGAPRPLILMLVGIVLVATLAALIDEIRALAALRRR